MRVEMEVGVILLVSWVVVLVHVYLPICPTNPDILAPLNTLIVTSECTALLNLEPRGVLDIGFSSCTAPEYLLLVSEYFGCVPGAPMKSGGSEVIWEFGS